MRTNIRLKLDMSARVAEFCDGHPDDSAPVVAAVSRIKELLARADALARQQRAGQIAVRASTTSKALLRRAIRADLVDLLRFAHTAALRQPEVPIRLQLPAQSVSHEKFLTTARVAVAEATANKEVLLTYGMPEAMLDGITRALEQYEGTVSRKFQGITSHVGASAELDTVTDELMELVHQLDAVNRRRFLNDPELRAAWASARNVAWPNPEVPATTPVAGSIQPAA